MKIGVVADDFTGASDIALTLAEAGMRTALLIGMPDGPVDAEAAVVALKSRTAPVAEAVAQSCTAGDWLRAEGAEQIVFKVCSTFDSTPQGNIGPVLDALAARLGAGPVMVCLAFPENARSVYMGHLFVGDRLLSETGMRDHPLTPMTDPDLRRVLAAQSAREVGHVPAGTVLAGPEAIRAALGTAPRHLIVDAIRDTDLQAIGAAAAGMPLLCGGSGIALGLPANFGANPAAPGWAPVTGPGAVLSGSCSEATRAQVARHAARAPAREITAEAVLAGEVTPEAVADWALALDNPPLIHSTAEPEKVRTAQARHGAGRAAAALEDFFARLAAELVGRGVRRLVVAGGETSGAVVSGLGLRALGIGPRAAPGVPLLRHEGPPVLALALKSGNFGGPDFFAEALALMEGRT